MIEFLYWRECPSHARALERLREEMERAGVSEDELKIVEVHTDELAEQLGFPGSPTILIDGADIQDPGDQPRGLTCRVYTRRDGRPSPLPDPADIADAIAGRGATTPARDDESSSTNSGG